MSENVEDKARAQGWKGPEEYNGPPERFKEAEEFLRVADEIGPVARERNKYLSDQVEKLKHTVDKQSNTLQNLAAHHKRTAELAYKRAMRELTAKREEAVDMGDKDAFRKAEVEMAELQAAAPQPDVIPDGLKPVEHDPDVVNKWVEANPWYEEDLILAQAAMVAGNIIAKKEPHLTTVEQLEKIKKKVMASYPDKFPVDDNGESKGKVSPVMGGTTHGGGGSGGGRKKSYGDLPADAKKACDDFVKQGLMSKDDYVKDYFELG